MSAHITTADDPPHSQLNNSSIDQDPPQLPTVGLLPPGNTLHQVAEIERSTELGFTSGIKDTELCIGAGIPPDWLLTSNQESSLIWLICFRTNWHLPVLTEPVKHDGRPFQIFWSGLRASVHTYCSSSQL